MFQIHKATAGPKLKKRKRKLSQNKLVYCRWRWGGGLGFSIFCCGLKMDCFCLVVKSCPTLCNPMDCSPPGSSVHGISQGKYWSGLPFPPPRSLPDPGIEPTSLALASGFFTTEPPGKPLKGRYLAFNPGFLAECSLA